MLKKMIWAAILLIGFVADPTNLWATNSRPKLGLALSGGGVRGLAHIGVLRALEKQKIPIDYIAGTSIGALIGALYSAGYTADEIEELVEHGDWNDMLFNDRVPRKDLPFHRKVHFERYLFDFEAGFRDGNVKLPSGLVFGQRLSLYLQSQFLRVADIEDFSKLPIPFRAVATDLIAGKQVIIDHGNLADAVRASSAYPGFFSPVEWEGRLLTDGGSSNNLPVDIVRSMGAERVIAVDISAPLSDRDRLGSFVDVTDQFVTIMIRKTTEQQRAQANLVLEPRRLDESTFSLTSMPEIIELGEREVEKRKSDLKVFEVSSEAYQAFDSKHRATHFIPKKIDKINISGFKRVSTDTITDQIRAKVGEDLDLGDLRTDLNRIHSQGDFERTDFTVNQTKGETHLNIRAVEKQWGPNYARLGVTWDGEIKGRKDGNAIISLDFTRLNRMNAEWMNTVTLGTVLEIDSEFRQPLDFWDLFFLSPKFNAIRMSRDFYARGDRLAVYEIDHFAGELDLGMDLGRFGEIRGGARRGRLNSEVQLGSSSLSSYDNQTGGIVGQFRFDQLDSSYYPSRGVYLSTDFYTSRSWLGGDYEYRKISAQAMGVDSFGPHTFFLYGSAGGNFGTALPVYDEFQVGGFRSLSGFRDGELTGLQFGVGRVGYLYRLPLSEIPLWKRIWLVGWAESGNVWNRKRDIGLDDIHYAGTGGLGFDTKLGAIFLAYGQSDSTHRQFYISVGRSFGLRNPRVF